MIWSSGFWNISHMLRQLPALGLGVAAMHDHAALLRLVEPADQAEQAALARPVVADQADARFLQVKRQPLEDMLAAAHQRHRFEADAVRGIGLGRGRLRQGAPTVPERSRKTAVRVASYISATTG
ncbi:hypothetical protein ASC92_07000 [Variovorax sp. Root411]|nr:hypothetical protein ASC92_07000 [Variovorax sp. Root411]